LQEWHAGAVCGILGRVEIHDLFQLSGTPLPGKQRAFHLGMWRARIIQQLLLHQDLLDLPNQRLPHRGIAHHSSADNPPGGRVWPGRFALLSDAHTCIHTPTHTHTYTFIHTATHIRTTKHVCIYTGTHSHTYTPHAYSHKSYLGQLDEFLAKHLVGWITLQLLCRCEEHV
jgi:hypothetical protein